MAELYKCRRLDPGAFKISKNFLFDRVKLEVGRVRDLRRFSTFSVSTVSHERKSPFLAQDVHFLFVG